MEKENNWDSTTVARNEPEKYCTKCRKICGHWANEHDLVFDCT